MERREKYCYVKVHIRGEDVVVAACDEELVGKVLEGHGLRVEVSEKFYKGERIPLSALRHYLRRGTIINLLGNDVVREAAKESPVLLLAAVEIGGVLHVQWIRRP